MHAVLHLRLPWNRHLLRHKALLKEVLALLATCQQVYTCSTETAVRSASAVATAESVMPLLLPVLERITA